MQSTRFCFDHNPGIETELVLSDVSITSRDALLSGRADAAFARAHGGPRALPEQIVATPAYLEPIHLLVSRDHPLSGRSTVRLAELRSHPVRVPGAALPAEWSDYYRDLSAQTGIAYTADTTCRPDSGLPARAAIGCRRHPPRSLT
ncbi:LysR substrate-binding domain-containing protein [Nocardia brasiliensis]|uniref:LysR substrate-binding domain-containing protein n=1 Tax=Nocardia brasiliensis TaxID=37326 RepID=UPI003D76D2C3